MKGEQNWEIFGHATSPVASLARYELRCERNMISSFRSAYTLSLQSYFLEIYEHSRECFIIARCTILPPTCESNSKYWLVFLQNSICSSLLIPIMIGRFGTFLTNFSNSSGNNILSVRGPQARKVVAISNHLASWKLSWTTQFILSSSTLSSSACNNSSVVFRRKQSSNSFESPKWQPTASAINGVASMLIPAWFAHWEYGDPLWQIARWNKSE